MVLSGFQAFQGVNYLTALVGIGIRFIKIIQHNGLVGLLVNDGREIMSYPAAYGIDPVAVTDIYQQLGICIRHASEDEIFIIHEYLNFRPF